MATTPVGDEPKFLNFSAFEPSGFFAAMSVACYSFVRNPEGIQGEDDHAEYDVYAGWRRAFTIILLHAVLMLTVLLLVTLDGASSSSAFWLGALMLAPWAPVAGAVRNTLTSWRRVRDMMRARTTRNEVAAIVRERFKMGQRALCVAAVVRVCGGGVPIEPLASLRRNVGLRAWEAEIRLQAAKAMETGSGEALELGVFWTVDQGPQPADIGRVDRFVRFYASWMDPLVWLWTVRLFDMPCSPFPEFTKAVESIGAQARVLDVVDSLQQGGTIGEAQMRRAMVGRHCLRCRLATRGAVEVFMESSAKSHGDLRASVWLKDIGTDWRGNFERIINICNEAVFMGEARGDRVPSADDLSPSYGDRSKVTTMKVFALLFAITRSLFNQFGESKALSEIQNIIANGLHTKAWWDDFWDRVAAKHGYDAMAPKNKIVIGEDSRAHFKAALRDSVDADLKRIVAALVRDPIKDSICGDPSCELHKESKLIFRVCQPP